MGQLQPLAQRSEIDAVLAHHVTHPQGVHADLPGLAYHVVAVPVQYDVPGHIPARGRTDRLGDAQGRAGGRVLLEAVVGFGDFDVILRPEALGNLSGQSHQQIDAQAHIRGLKNGNGLAGLIDCPVILGPESRGPDHQGHMLLDAVFDDCPRGNRSGKIDHHVQCGWESRRQFHMQCPNSRHRTGVLAQERATRLFNGPGDVQLRIFRRQGDQPPAHATGSPGYGNFDHGNSRTCYGAAPLMAHGRRRLGLGRSEAIVRFADHLTIRPLRPIIAVIKCCGVLQAPRLAWLDIPAIMDFSFFKKSRLGASRGGTPPPGGGGAGNDGSSTGDDGSESGFKRDSRKAAKWFAHAQTVADHDYAIECFISGFRFDPDNMAMYEALREVAFKRNLAGGKPAGLGERMKGGGKTPIDKLLHAVAIWAKDPRNPDLMLSVMEQAGAANEAESDINLADLVLWIGTMVLESISQPGKKVSKSTLVTVRDLFAKVQAYDKAVEACRMALRLDQNNANLLQDLKNLEAERTLQQGGYSGEQGGFKAGVKNLKQQQDLDQSDRVASRTTNAVDNEIATRRAEYDEDPHDVVRMEKLVDALRKKGTDEASDEAVKLLHEAWEQSGQYKFKMRAGDIHMSQLNRNLREAKQLCDQKPHDADLRKHFQEQARKKLQFELDEFAERVKNYPTDLGLKFELGKRLHFFKRYDEAIASFQEAQADPKLRSVALQYLGMCYHAKGWLDEAIQTFRRAIENHRLVDDNTALELRYQLMDALEQSAAKSRSLEQAQEAQQVGSQVLQTNINFRDIRLRMDKIRNMVAELQGKSE